MVNSLTKIIMLFLVSTSYIWGMPLDKSNINQKPSLSANKNEDRVLSKSDKYCPEGSTVFWDSTEVMYTLPQKSPNVTRIAFLGDSLTEGGGVKMIQKLFDDGHNGYMTNGVKQGQLGYPYLVWETLNKNKLSEKYQILNFGFSGRHAIEQANIMQERDSNSYMQTCDFLRAMKSEADIYVVMLGSNDILQDAQAINKYDIIKHGYEKIIKAIQSLKHGPEVYLMIPPPMIWQRMPKQGTANHGANLSTVWLADLIKDVQNSQQIKDDHIINLQEVISLNNAGDLLSDYAHPNNKGYATIAKKVYSTLFSSNKKN